LHWADVVASRLEEAGNVHRIATGITPSGHIHVGNMREILTGDLIHRAASDSGLDSTLYYLADDFDPLRKVYPFLPDDYSIHVGKPLSEIPAPSDEESYADYFLGPFLASVRKLGMEPVVLRSSDSYREGKYAKAIKILLDNRIRIKEILQDVSGRDLPDDWIPYNPKCSDCGRINSATPLSWDYPNVHYICECGHEGKADIRTDQGKLPWRLDWPARWYWLGVTCEPFGKDHAAAGGSYDTSSKIIREILGSEPPEPVVYEWIQLKGKGAMSSSTGVVISAVDMLNMVPPEVLRFLIARYQPSRHIDLDPGLGVLSIVDDFDRYEKEYIEAGGQGPDPQDRLRTYQLSMTDPAEKALGGKIQVPYRHLVTLVQLVDDIDGLLEKIKRTQGLDEINEITKTHIEERAECVRFWLERFAPDGVRFELQDPPSDKVIEGLSSEQVRSLKAMREDFKGIEWDAEEIHNAIYEGSRSGGINPKITFKAFYRILLGKDRGPRLGFFLSAMDRDDVFRRIDLVLERR
jgi:lysyl-tRNA synthetase class 1